MQSCGFSKQPSDQGNGGGGGVYLEMGNENALNAVVISFCRSTYLTQIIGTNVANSTNQNDISVRVLPCIVLAF